MNLLRVSPFAWWRYAFFSLFFIFLLYPIQKAFAQEPIIELKVVADQANIRLQPDISSIIIRQVPQDTILKATEKRGAWFAVRLTSKQGVDSTGYVHESLVLVISPQPKEKKPQKKQSSIREVRPVETEPEEEPKTSPYSFSLCIMGGGNYVHGGDLNPGIEGLADLYEDILGVQGNGKIGAVHLGYVLGMEVSFPLSERLDWGIGLEHFMAKNDSQMEYTQEASSSTLIIQPGLQATPINLFLAFHPFSNLYAKGGISYYFARCSYTYQIHTGDLIEKWEGKADAHGFGLSGSLGFVRPYTSNLSFFAEITGRLAKFQGFKGKENYLDDSGNTSSIEGTLYLIQTQILDDRTHPVLFIRETRPNEAGVIAAEKARIDLSGISLKIGLRVHF